MKFRKKPVVIEARYTMSAARLLTLLERMPYRDMVMFASALQARLSKKHQAAISSNALAEALVSVEPGEVGVSETTAQEEKILAEIFRVQRSVSIHKKNGSWVVNSPTMPGGRAVDPDLRTAVNMFLDQQIAAHLLSK